MEIHSFDISLNHFSLFVLTKIYMEMLILYGCWLVVFCGVNPREPMLFEAKENIFCEGKKNITFNWEN